MNHPVPPRYLEELLERSEPPLTAGSCLLQDPRAASIVQKTLLHFEGTRYNLLTWCVMPNHVHVLCTPSASHNFSRVLHSWKSFSAHEINKALGRNGPLWERESFNHLVRTAEQLQRIADYIDQNPVAAGFCDDPSEWTHSARGSGFQAAHCDFRDPRKLPFVEPVSRGELAHLHKPGSSYFVTWRLRDAVLSPDPG